MSWGKFFLMPDFGSDDYHRRFREMSRSAAQSGKEVAQDEQIRQLRYENRELKLYLAGLMQLLVNKGAIAQGDVEQLVTLVDRAQQEANRVDEPTSPDLEAIAAAAKQSRPK
jgi:hypothetical protein